MSLSKYSQRNGTNVMGSYEHHSIDEPAILLGGAFMSDVVENAEADSK